MKLKLLVLFSCFCFGVQGQEYHCVKTLRNNLLIYDSTYKAFVPLLDINSPITTFSYILRPDQFKDQYFYLKATPGTALYINNQLVQRFLVQTHKYINVNSISKNLRNSLIITVNVPFNQSLSIMESLKIVGKNSSMNYSDEPVLNEFFDRRNTLEYNSIILICLTIFFAFFAIQRNVSKRLYEAIYNLRYMISDIKVEESLTISNIDRYKVLLLIFNSLIIGFIIFVFTSSYQVDSSFNKNVIPTILKISLSVLFFFILKYTYVIVISNIFKIGKWTNIQFFEFIKLTMNFGLYLLLIYLLFYSPFTFFSVSSNKVFNLSTVILILVFLTRIAFTIKKITGFRSFYLISYLCIAEIVPITLFYIVYFG